MMVKQSLLELLPIQMECEDLSDLHDLLSPLKKQMEVAPLNT